MPFLPAIAISASRKSALTNSPVGCVSIARPMTSADVTLCAPMTARHWPITAWAASTDGVRLAQLFIDFDRIGGAKPHERAPDKVRPCLKRAEWIGPFGPPRDMKSPQDGQRRDDELGAPRHCCDNWIAVEGTVFRLLNFRVDLAQHRPPGEVALDL